MKIKPKPPKPRIEKKSVSKTEGIIVLTICASFPFVLIFLKFYIG